MKIYIPTQDELYQMQELKVNVYKYLFIKAVEATIAEGLKYPSKGILKNAYKYLKEDPYFVHAIGRLYPSEIQYSEIGKYDTALCDYLIRHQKDESIHSLDALAYFNSSTLNNYIILNNAISELNYKLPNNPQYRFEYKENILLDNIFGGEINESYVSSKSAWLLKDIEPIYALRFSEDKFDIRSSKDLAYLLNTGINAYAKRYGIDSLGDERIGKDILTNPDTDVKRLIKCMQK